MIAKKTGEMKAELEAAVALVHQYVPPDPGMMQVVMNAGTASLAQAGPGALVLRFPGYVKPGDALSLTFDTAVRSLRQLDVATFLDTPESPVTLRVATQSLPDGTRHPGSVVLGINLSQQTDTLPETSRLNAFSVVLKGYYWGGAMARDISRIYLSFRF